MQANVFKKLSLVLSALIFLISALVLAGWVFHVRVLTTFYPGLASMKINTAIGFILGTISLALLYREESGPRYFAGKLCAGLVALLGLITISQFVFGINFGIDDFFISAPAIDSANPFPSRMSPITAACLSLLGLALLMLDAEKRARANPTEILAMASLAASLVGIIGYIYSVQALYHIGIYSSMALHTACASVLMASAILLARPARGLPALLARNTTGSILARRLLPAAILVPVLGGWLRVLGERVGYYESPFGTGLFATLLVSIFVALIWATSLSIDAGEMRRRSAEESLRRALEFDEAVMLNMGEGLYTVDERGLVTSMNPAAEKLFGWRLEELRGKKMHAATHYKHRDGTPFPPEECAGLQVLREGKTLSGHEDVFIRKDGSFFDVVYSASPIREGEKVTGLVVVFRDVTHRKQAERALRESEDRLRLATETGKIGLWAWDIPGNHVSWTDAIYSIHGLTKEQFDGTVEAFSALLHPDDREPVAKAIARSLNDGTPYELTFRALRPDGKVIWLFTNAVVVRADGKPLRMLGATTDITGLKEAEEALQRAKRDAEEASRAKDQFLAMLSHELRTPLTPVLMTASALESDPTVAPHLREQLTMMRRNIELEARLIDDLLDVTRIVHGKFELHEELVDIHPAIEHAISISTADLLAKRMEVTKQFEARAHHCVADAARLQEVFWNILRNAVKFTPAGGQITIATHNEQNDVVIEFSDTGVGIDPQLQPRIFDAFEQGDTSIRGHYGGLGLGLAISKRIIDLHHGTIGVRSAGRGQGSAFFVRLKAAETAPVEKIVRADDGAPFASVRAEILVVEDHRDTADVLRRVLEKAGYRVKLRETIAEARALALEQNFDLLISDIGLPDGSGLDLMRFLHKKQNLSGIALSGFGTQDDLAASAAAGFAAHLTKPIDLERLRNAIAQILRAREVSTAIR